MWIPLTRATDQKYFIPLGSETHGGEDVPIYAVGAGSDLVRGVMEQHVIFHVMMEASKMATR